jgi:hypothetical protein
MTVPVMTQMTFINMSKPEGIANNQANKTKISSLHLKAAIMAVKRTRAWALTEKLKLIQCYVRKVNASP